MDLLIAQVDNMLPARLQMAFTLGFHIILACLGVGLPVLMLAAEGWFLRTGDKVWRTLARRWSQAFAVMFAIGAVTGTMLSFELGLLWPGFMGRWGAVIGMPFTMEGFAFFVEAIFAGIYLYGWDRLPPRLHWLTGVPVAVSGFLSAFFVVMANSWMNSPAGFRIEDGQLTDIDPVAAMFNAATGAQVAHMIVAAYLVTGFSVAAFYAFALLRGRTQRYNQLALSLGLSLALPLVPIQMLIGDWSAKVVAASQPVKFAAMEATFETQASAPLHIGGIPNEETQTVDYSLEIPGALSFLAHLDWNAEVQGLNEVSEDVRPPVAVVHIAFQLMVGIGVAMMVLACWVALHWLRSGGWPRSRLFLYCVLAMGPLSVVALQAGWVVTEVGRQPWIVQGHMLTREAVTAAPGLWNVFYGTVVIYFAIGAVTATILLRLAAVKLPEDHDAT